MGGNGKKFNSVQEFYLTAVEYCKLLEYNTDLDKIDFLSRARVILTFVYLKASLLSKTEETADGDLEKFVQEEDWIYIRDNVANILGGTERFIEVSLPGDSDSNNYENISLSESFADIYQDLKDFVTTYEIGNEDAIATAVYECLQNFEKIWGPRLLALLAFLHNYLYNRELYDDESGDVNKRNEDIDTSNWFINQRFEE